MPLSDQLLSSYPLSNITQAQARDRIRGDIGLRGNNLLTDADINSWMNEISDTIAQKFRWYRTSRALNAVSSVKEYKLPPGCLSVEEVWHNNLPMQRLQMADFQMNYAYWRRQGPGVPIFYYMRGAGGFGLQPTPGTDIENGIIVMYVGVPPHPVNDVDFYTIPYGGERALVSGAKMLAAEKDSSGEGARRYDMLRRRYEDDLMALERMIESVAEGDVTVLGADLEPELGGWQRWLGFDPMRSASPPPG